MKKKEQYLIDENDTKIAKDGVTKLYRLVAGKTFKHKFFGEIKKGTKDDGKSTKRLSKMIYKKGEGDRMRIFRKFVKIQCFGCNEIFHVNVGTRFHNSGTCYFCREVVEE